MVTWDRTPLGLETAAPCQPRAALAAEGSERRWNLLNSKVPALHREAEHDTTGSFSRQPPVHTWIGACRAREASQWRQHSALFAENCVKLRLTLWFYCGKRAARRHGFVGEPRKSWCFAGMRARVRRSIAVLRLDRRRGRGPVAGSGRGVEFSHRLGRPSGRRRQANPLRSRSRQDHPVSCLCAGRSVPGGGGHSPGQLSASRRASAPPGAGWSRRSVMAWSCRAVRGSCST